MDFDLQKIVANMNVFALVVVGALAIMAIATLTIFVERWWSYERTRRRARAFAPVAAKLLGQRDGYGLLEAAAAAPQSYLSYLLDYGMKTFIAAVQQRSRALPPVELVRRELERKGDAQAAQVRRGLSVLASVGSTAPFVGLLGTVIGIIAAFEGIATEGSGGLGAVSAGIAEALVVTAFGLMVAIPAVLIFNFLSTKSDAIMLALDQARSEFLDHLESQSAAYERIIEQRIPAELPTPEPETAVAASAAYAATA